MAKSKKPTDIFDPIIEARIKEALERPVEEKRKTVPAPTPLDQIPRWGIKPAPPRSSRKGE